jgi:imidazole glycerol-phosphate synthase subunit HisH
MVTLVDYGLGNIQAFANIYRRLNIAVSIARTAEDLVAARRIILPGVGSFDWAMDRLEASGMRLCLDDLVLRKKRPVMGICVGMQMIALRSDEGSRAGLGWLGADVKRLPAQATQKPIQLPHMGWNDVEATDNSLFSGIVSPRFYFLHSYYFAPVDLNHVLASVNYHGTFAAAVGGGNIFGVQFHPEKSHHWGVQLLKNFAEI